MRRAFGLCCAALLVLGGCTCLDLATPRDYPCTYGADAGGECPDGYRCGLENRCHEIGLPLAWRCATDDDCEASWRCGPQGYCLDPAAEALTRTDAGTFTASPVGPPLPLELPTAVEHAAQAIQLSIQSCDDALPRAPDLPDGGYRDDIVPHHWATANVVASELFPTGFYKVLRWQDGRQTRYDGGLPQLSDCDGGSGAPLRAWPLDVVRAPPPPTPATSMIDDGLVTYVLTSAGTLCTYELSSDLALSHDCNPVFNLKSEPNRLRGFKGTEHPGEYLFAFNASEFQILSLWDGGLSPAMSVYAPDGTPLQINDLLEYDTQTQPILLAATARGLYARGQLGIRISDAGTLGPDEWEQVTWEGRCNWWMFGDAPVGLGFVNGEELVVKTHRQSWILATDTYSFAKSSPAQAVAPVPTPSCVNLPSKKPGETYVSDGTEVNPCPGRRTLWAHIGSEPLVLETGTASDAGVHKGEVRCGDVDGDFTVLDATGGFFSSTSIEPLPPSARFHRPVRGSANSAFPAVADDIGHLWFTDDTQWAFQPLVLDEAPGAVYRAQKAIGATRAPELYGKVNDVRVVLDRPSSFEELPTGYLTGADPYYPVSSTVDGRPSWTVVEANPPGHPRVLATVERLPPGARQGGLRAISRVPEPLLFGKPYLAAAANTPTGRTVEVVTSFDTLLAADVTDQLSQMPSGKFDPSEFFSAPEPEVKLIAMARTPVQSLVLLEPDLSQDGGAFVEGYLLQASRVFHVSAPNFTVWRSNEIVLEDTSEPLKVFADGRRGRVGMKSGAVYSLPSRLPLAAPLPPAAGEVSDYVQACGNLFALASAGLFYLRVGDSPMGTWEEVPIAGSAFPASAREFYGGKIAATKDALRVYLRNGLVAKVTGFSCP